MRQAIQTKYFGPSNIHGARVRAYAAAGYKTIEWDHALNAEQNHERAASELAACLCCLLASAAAAAAAVARARVWVPFTRALVRFP